LIVECRVRVRKGQLGIAVASADSPHFISHERVLSAEDSIQRVRLWVGRPIDADSVIFRNVASDGIVTEFELYDLSAEAMTSGSAFPVSWSEGSTSIPLAELDGALAWAQTVWDVPSNGRRPAVSVGGLEIVDVDELAALLGPTAQPTLPPNAATKALSDWKMETDDAPILEALWRTVAPRRHLEFGTWEGFGTALVARVTDAEIWTLNLPEGEAGRDGATLYAATDAGSSIGRLYRQAGYGDRVHQILCDSRAFDTAPFESNPFDTVLIDGGHTPDVVASDTLKALRVLRPGGTCVWHDFCPDPETLRRNMAPLGVVQAAVENFAVWAAAFERLFWIRKSWILVGLDRK
jgi:predicted O-methyltransferase YrrM